MMEQVKFGIIGYGHIGRRHAKYILDNNRSQLVAIYDILPKEKLLIKDVDVVLFKESFQQLIAMDIDVVNICTPNYLHASMAIACLSAGKHVVIEKPMALTTIDAEKIINAAKKAQKSVFCVMQNRFSPTIVWLKEVVEKKLLGKIHMVSVHCLWNRNKQYFLQSDWHGSIEKDGGPLFTQFSHFIDIIYWLFGDIEYINADFFSFNKQNYIDFEDSGVVKFHFVNKIVGVLNYSIAVWKQNLESSITIIGEFGSVKIGGQYMDQIISCDIKDYVLPALDIDLKCNDYGNYKGSASNHDKMINNVLDVLLNNQTINTNAIDGLNVVNIIERIYNQRN